jgi:hypothetical protein
MYAYNNKHSLRSNGKTHQTDSQNSDTTAPSGRELCHLQFLLQAASPETYGYSLVICCLVYTYRIHVFPLHHRVQTDSGARPASSQMDRGPFAGVKAAGA